MDLPSKKIVHTPSDDLVDDSPLPGSDSLAITSTPIKNMQGSEDSTLSSNHDYSAAKQQQQPSSSITPANPKNYGNFFIYFFFVGFYGAPTLFKYCTVLCKKEKKCTGSKRYTKTKTVKPV